MDIHNANLAAARRWATQRYDEAAGGTAAASGTEPGGGGGFGGGGRGDYEPFDPVDPRVDLLPARAPADVSEDEFKGLADNSRRNHRLASDRRPVPCRCRAKRRPAGRLVPVQGQLPALTAVRSNLPQHPNCPWLSAAASIPDYGDRITVTVYSSRRDASRLRAFAPSRLRVKSYLLSYSTLIVAYPRR